MNKSRWMIASFAAATLMPTPPMAVREIFFSPVLGSVTQAEVAIKVPATKAEVIQRDLFMLLPL